MKCEFPQCEDIMFCFSESVSLYVCALHACVTPVEVEHWYMYTYFLALKEEKISTPDALGDVGQEEVTESRLAKCLKIARSGRRVVKGSQHLTDKFVKLPEERDFLYEVIIFKSIFKIILY